MVDRRLGEVVRIDMGSGWSAFARVLSDPLVGFYQLQSKQIPPIERIISAPIAFKIWVADSAFKQGDWHSLSVVPLDGGLEERPFFFKKDPISGKYSKFQSGAEIEVPASKHECEELERASVWSHAHVMSRLRDYFEGKPNKWVDSMKP